jgi:hypothetical protein
VSVPPQVPPDQEHPYCAPQLVESRSWVQGVTVPVQVVVPDDHRQPLVQVVDVVFVLHKLGTPVHVPPMPESLDVHVQPSAVQFVW